MPESQLPPSTRTAASSFSRLIRATMCAGAPFPWNEDESPTRDTMKTSVAPR
jgi:hypothetical protein